MSSELSLTETAIGAIREELLKIGLHDARVSLVSLDNAHGALMVTIESGAFEGQTFLDREMRVRPAVARALSLSGLPKAAYVIEAISPDDVSLDIIDDDESGAAEDAVAFADPQNRRTWREQRNAVLRALTASNYIVDTLERETLFVATRSLLSDEAILLGFATSTNAKTIDLTVRKSMQVARQARRFSSCYYVSMLSLSSPFANQSNADWLTVETAKQFLHRLNSSISLARELAKQCVDDLERSGQDHSGPVVEPTTRTGEGETILGFFDYIKQWANRPEPSFLVLMAPAGYGKTTITLELARRFAEDFLASGERPVPLLVPFEAVRRTVDFEALMHKRLAQLRGGTFGVFAELLKSANAVLFVDGFDELADDAGSGVAEAQIRSMRALVQGRAKVILAGRSVFTQQFAGDASVAQRLRSLLGDVKVDTLEILRFDFEQVTSFVRTRRGLAPAHQEALVDFATSSPDHEELCGSPLFLRILCSLAKSNKLPDSSEVVDGIEYLINRVCEREEERQHLGIGVSAQIEYLGWIATHIFRAGQAGTTQEDVRFFAEVMEDQMKHSATELVGRLADHALLAPWVDKKVSFIHPLIRDILLGRDVMRKVVKERGLEDLAVRDLPEGTVRHLARSGDHLLDFVPQGWLSQATKLPSQTRRNLFRIALEGTRAGENPREWVDEKWLIDKVVSALDISGLPLTSTSFDGLKLNRVDMSNVMFDDCDFRGTHFEECDASSSLFMDCRISSMTVAAEGQAAGATIRMGDVATKVQTWDNLMVALSGKKAATDADTQLDAEAMPDEPLQKREVSVKATNIRTRCLALAADLLSKLVVVEKAGVRFHRIRLDEFRDVHYEGQERLIADRVIASTIVSSLCEIELSGGSKENITLAKRWRGPIVDFIKRSRVTPGLREVFDMMVARAARYV